jgi:hypothetical protein
MKTEGISEHDLLGLSKDEPIILVGEAKTLRGELHLHNPGTDRIQLGEASLRLQLAQSTQPTPFAQVPLPAGLQPGQAQRVKLVLDLDPQTPPGEYKGEVEVAGHTRPVIVYVAEVVRLDIAPKVLVIDQPSGSTAVKRVILTNEGNVPLTIGPIGQVALGEELMLRRSVSATVAAAGEKEDRLVGKLFADLINEDAKAVLAAAGYLKVVNAGVVIQPGEVRLLSLEIHLPENLSPNRRYIGRVPLYTSDLEFVVVPLPGPTGQPAKPAKPTSVKPTSVKPTSVKPTSVKPTSVKPTSAKPTSAKPRTGGESK